MKPFHRNELVPAIELALARFTELVALSEQAEGLSDQLETRKVLDRAKGHLMDRFGMTEKEAFVFVQRNAMATRATMREVAARVLDGDLTP